MKVFFDGKWTIERDDGTKIRLTANEASMLYYKMRRDLLWDEVALRFENSEQWDEIKACREDILDDIDYNSEDVSEDAVYNAVSAWVDLDEEN